MTNKDHIERTKRMIEVMQAYVDGRPIESMTKYSAWTINPNPLWDFGLADYRIAKTSDTINWSHVAPEFKYMARDKNGVCYLYQNKPILHESLHQWEDTEEFCSNAQSHLTYHRGTCDWKDSLVIRPGVE